MQPIPLAHAYALRLRVGRQNSLVSPLLVRLYARLMQIQDAGVVASLRSFAQSASEAQVLIHVPEYPCQKTRNLLVAWAETMIDALNHAQPYSTPGLLDSGLSRDAGAHQVLVRCEPTDAAHWLRGHADPRTAAALIAMSEHLPSLLTVDMALLKTALPVAISVVLGAQYPRGAAAMSSLVFANAPSSRFMVEMLATCEKLESRALVVRRANLPSTLLPVFAQLVSALQHGMAITSARNAQFAVVRLLLNQLGFDGPESDYLILLALPPKMLRVLQQHGGRYHDI